MSWNPTPGTLAVTRAVYKEPGPLSWAHGRIEYSIHLKLAVV